MTKWRKLFVAEVFYFTYFLFTSCFGSCTVTSFAKLFSVVSFRLPFLSDIFMVTLIFKLLSKILHFFHRFLICMLVSLQFLCTFLWDDWVDSLQGTRMTISNVDNFWINNLPSNEFKDFFCFWYFYASLSIFGSHLRSAFRRNLLELSIIVNHQTLFYAKYVKVAFIEFFNTLLSRSICLRCTKNQHKSSRC